MSYCPSCLSVEVFGTPQDPYLAFFDAMQQGLLSGHA